MRRRLGLLLVVPLAALAATSTAGGDPTTTVAAAAAPSTARAVAISVAPLGQAGASAAAVSAPPSATAPATAFAYPADGSIAAVTSAAAAAATADGETASASASADVAALSLFGGEITVATIAARVATTASTGSSSIAFDGSAVSGLVVLGQPVEPAPGLQVPLGDWGTLTVLAQTVPPGGATAPPAEGTLTALAVHLDVDHGGLPAGSDVVVGALDAAAQPTPPPAVTTVVTETAPTTTQAPAPTTRPATTAPPPPPPVRALPPKPSRPSARTQREGVLAPDELPATPEPAPALDDQQGLHADIPPALLPPPDVSPKLTAGGYVFPVYGPSGFGDTFGAARADVSWHHGDDIFAPLGAPILSVADGTVFSVGWNKIGGNRLWLRDDEGNEFYYAHLSAFSPLAVDGARVKAGAVVGFVGNTGDAEATPPHLHFEIHPVSLLFLGYEGVVNPTSYLDAWRHAEDLRFTGVAGWAPTASAAVVPKPGAILLESSDIGSGDGLDPESLRRALTAQPAEGADALAAAVPASGADPAAAEGASGG